MEKGPFGMILIAEYKADHLCYRTNFIGTSIYIVYQDWIGQFEQIKLLALGVVPISAFTHSTC